MYSYVDIDDCKRSLTHPHATTTGPPASPPIKITLLPIPNERDSDHARDVRVRRHAIAMVKTIQLAVLALTRDSGGRKQDTRKGRSVECGHEH